jgi:hypothetical protein
MKVASNEAFIPKYSLKDSNRFQNIPFTQCDFQKKPLLKSQAYHILIQVSGHDFQINTGGLGWIVAYKVCRENVLTNI